MLNGIPDSFPIGTAMPLSFEPRAFQDPKVDFTALVMNALEDINKAKKRADEMDEDVYIYGKDAEIHDAAVADAIHSNKKHLFSSSLKTHTNLLQTLLNLQI